MPTVLAFNSGIANQEDRLPSDAARLTVDQAKNLVAHASSLLSCLGEDERKVAWLLEEALNFLSDRHNLDAKVPVNLAY